MEKYAANNPIAVYQKTSLAFDNMSSHFHHLYEIILVEEGIAEFDIKGEKFQVGQNQIIFISNLEKHSVKILQYPYKRTVITMTTHFTLFNIKEAILVSVLSHRPPNFPYVFGLSDVVFKKVRRLALDLITECDLKDYFWINRSAAIITGILIDIYRFNPSYFDQIEKSDGTNVILEIQKYISSHFDDDITLEVLADKFFFSTFYISRKFKEITGYNIKNYVILNRISYAKELLRYSKKSITEVGASIGYENINQFTRIFKQYDNQTPTAYRNSYLNKASENDLMG